MIAGLYAVTPDGLPTDTLLDRVEQALLGGVRLLQYRAKPTGAPGMQVGTAGSRRRLAQAQAISDRCRAHGAMLIINDDPGLAVAVDADGVHLGRDDGSVRAARSLLGAGRCIGVSCYDSLDRARAAAAEGADYVAFGSMYASAIKPGAVRAPLGLLGQARAQINLPIVAIGGIDLSNAAEVRDAGAHAFAIISAVFHASDIGAAVGALRRIADAVPAPRILVPN